MICLFQNLKNQIMTTNLWVEQVRLLFFFLIKKTWIVSIFDATLELNFSCRRHVYVTRWKTIPGNCKLSDNKTSSLSRRQPKHKFACQMNNNFAWYSFTRPRTLFRCCISNKSGAVIYAGTDVNLFFLRSVKFKYVWLDNNGSNVAWRYFSVN